MAYSYLSTNPCEQALRSGYSFNGVTPDCVQGRWFIAGIDDKILYIHEWTIAKAPEHEELLHRLENDHFELHQLKHFKSYKLPVSDIITEQTVRRPVCIGCHGNLFILQYFSIGKKYSRFLLVDTDLGIVQSFEDLEHYFMAEYAHYFTFQCHVSPDQERVLIRLPHDVLSPNKWSKILIAKVESLDCENEHRQYQISDLQGGHSLRDRCNQMVTFDPREPSHIVFASLDYYAITCKVLVRDFLTGSVILEEKIHLNHSRKVTKKRNESERSDITISSGSEDDTDSEEDEPEEFVGKAHINFCQSGEIFILLCETRSGSHFDIKQVGYLLMYAISSETLEVLESWRLPANDCSLAQYGYTYWPQISPCDSTVQIVCLVAKKPVLSKKFRLPKKPNLKNSCREVILQNCNTQDLSALGLPNNLLKFVRFKY